MAKKKNPVYCFADTGTEDIRRALSDIDVDEMKADEVVPIDIPIFREGMFAHPYYGELVFDEKFLNTLIANHTAGVVPRAIAFDQDHRMSDGRAVAWIRDDVDDPLYIKKMSVPQPDGKERPKSVLFARAYLNRRGARMIKANEYRYFSSEVSQNYTTREKVKIEGEKKKKDDEAESYATIEHGPTLLGGGLTNNPFIPALGDYQFSDKTFGEQGDSVFALQDTEGGNDMLLFSWADEPEQDELDKPVEEQHPEPVEPEASAMPEEQREPTEPPQQFGDKQMLKELIQQYNAADSNEAKLQILDAGTQKFANDEVALATISAFRNQTEAAIEQEKAFNQAVAEATRHEERARKFSEENASLRIEAQKATEIAHSTKVKLFCEELQKENHFPAVVEEVKAVLQNSPVDVRGAQFKFDADSEESQDLMGVIKRVLDKIPSESRMDFSEKSQAQPTSTSEVGEAKPEGADAPDPTEAPEEPSEEKAEAAKLSAFEERYGRPATESERKYIDKDGVLQTKPVSNEE